MNSRAMGSLCNCGRCTGSVNCAKIPLAASCLALRMSVRVELDTCMLDPSVPIHSRIGRVVCDDRFLGPSNALVQGLSQICSEAKGKIQLHGTRASSC